MEIFPDLTPYGRFIEPFSFKGVLNIGWVDLSSDFSKGNVSPNLLEKLRKVAFGKFAMKGVVEPSRNYPECPICGPIVSETDGKALVDSELWIPGDNVVFASPIQLIHFIEVHGYLPPEVYLAALANLSPENDFDGDAAYRSNLQSSGWFANQFKS